MQSPNALKILQEEIQQIGCLSIHFRFFCLFLRSREVLICRVKRPDLGADTEAAVSYIDYLLTGYAKDGGPFVYLRTNDLTLEENEAKIPKPLQKLVLSKHFCVKEPLPLRTTSQWPSPGKSNHMNFPREV